MDMTLIMGGLTIAGVVVLFILVLAGLFNAFYIKVSQGHALIVNDMSAVPKVHFTGAMVLPVVYKREVMKISLITLQIDRRGKDGLICGDNLRADITVAFYLRVNETAEDVLKVAKTVGVERASNKDAVDELFNAKFSEALKTVGKQMNFLELFENRIQFREKIVQVIGDDLSGYVLEDVAIDYLEQTPKSDLDANNILDSEGIRRITEITSHQNVETNRLERDEQLAIKKKNVETREAMLSLERQQADAEAKQKREIETLRAREHAEVLKVKEEERQKAEQARLETEEAIAVRDEAKQRQVEIAAENRKRAVIIEKEKVEKAQQLEQVNREREVELETIAKEKALEEERKIIANTISERISVEKRVAEEEERIKDVRTISEAEREKQATVLGAEAAAQEELVKQVKQAEAEEIKAGHTAKQMKIIAEAELDAAARDAEAMKKRASGAEAEAAAPGYAEAKVKEAMADALEREGVAKAKAAEASGLAEARIIEAQSSALEKEGVAKANAAEANGLAEAKVIEAKAIAMEREGLADAKVLEEKLSAQAKGEEEIGLAEANAEKEKGVAQATVIRERARAEAEGLVEKFQAMANMDPAARDFEEYKMRLEAVMQEVMATIEANKEIASDQAEVLAAALGKTNIDIVSGEGEYFGNFAKALSLGKAMNGLAGKSAIAKGALEKLVSLIPDDNDQKGVDKKDDSDQAAS